MRSTPVLSDNLDNHNGDPHQQVQCLTTEKHEKQYRFHRHSIQDMTLQRLLQSVWIVVNIDAGRTDVLVT